MKDEQLGIREQEFFHSNVKGYWKPQDGVYPANNIFPADDLFPGEGEE